MTEKEFQEKYLPQVKEIIGFAMGKNQPDFYKKKYQNKQINPETINTYEEFKKLPTLEKEELLKTDLKQRLFLDLEDIDMFNLSSGTTNINRPLITASIKEPDFPYSENNVLKKHNVSKVLLLLSPVRAIGKARYLRTPFVYGDIQNLGLAATVATNLEIDAIITNPTILYRFIPYLKQTNFNFNNIKMVTLSTEYCTTQKLKYFKKVLPSAFFRLNYGSSEIGGTVGYRCEYISDMEPNVFHLRDTNMIEIEDGPEPNEMICTHIIKRGFPLIRYKTGDFATIENYKCKCGADHIIKLHGRASYDVFRISGTLLYTQLIADCIEMFHDSLEPVFELHVTEIEKNNNFKTKLELYLVPKNKKVIGSEAKFAELIQNNLQVSSEKTLNDFVNEGLFVPLEVIFFDSLESGPKSKNIIPHLS